MGPSMGQDISAGTAEGKGLEEAQRTLNFSSFFKGSKLKYLLCALPKHSAPLWGSSRLVWLQRCWLLKAFGAHLLT